MSDVRRHYNELLGPVYSWIVGDFESATLASARLFGRLGLSPGENARALDLGAGPGTQSIPLADLGYEVTALDFCAGLVAELQARAGDRPITAIEADIRDFEAYVDLPPELVVCMGDTLVHLPDHRSADDLLYRAASALAEGGLMIVSLRDYDTPGPTGADRFLPIRSTDERIFTCFLEYGDDHVTINDILQTRTPDGWTLDVSSYRKIRFSVSRVEEVLSRAGMEQLDVTEDEGMHVVVARKPIATA
jgi:SAM-dependent methyltransferase